MKRYISVKPEVKEVLMRKYSVGRRTIWEACSFVTKNKRGNNIRKDALAMGGVYSEEGWKPNCEVSITEDGDVTLRFANRVSITAESFRLILLHPEVRVLKYSNFSQAELMSQIRMAQAESERLMLSECSTIKTISL